MLGLTVLAGLAGNVRAWEAQGGEKIAVRMFLESVYARYADATTGPETLGRDAPQLFSRRLVALIREDQRLARGEVGLLDHDPICSCQDWRDLAVHRIEVTVSSATRAAAVVEFTNAGQRVQTRFTLSREAAGWRIDDVREPHAQSLRVTLERGLAKSRARSAEP